jgi:hypothetical protein
MNWILALVPDQALVLVIVLIGLALMCGMINARRAFGLIGGIILFLILSPFIGSLVDALPGWLLLGLVLVLGLSMLRAVSNFLIGRGATNEMVGSLAADLVRLGFRAIFFVLTLPFRALGWLARVAL